MLERIKAWSEILRIGLNTSKLYNEINVFYKTNVLKVLKNEGLFEFLINPRTFQEISDKFTFSDKRFLSIVLDILVSDNIIVYNNDQETYSSNIQYINEFLKKFENSFPRAFDEYMVSQWTNIITHLPDALRGNKIEFTEGLNMFHWDSMLRNNIYPRIDSAVYKLANITNNQYKNILEVYSANGVSTAILFCENITNSQFIITGVDTDTDFVNIAQNEFESIVRSLLSNKKKFSEIEIENLIQTNKKNFPKFMKIDSYNQLPFADNTFDAVYLSKFCLQIWDYHQIIREAIRVTKPNGGIIFGSVTLRKHPLTSNKFDQLNYVLIHFLIINGSNGHPIKNDFISFINSNGGSKLKIITPVSLFKFIKQ